MARRSQASCRRSLGRAGSAGRRRARVAGPTPFASAQRVKRRTPLYGRAAEGMLQLNVRVTLEAKRRLEHYCFEHTVLKADVIDLLILENLPEA